MSLGIRLFTTLTICLISSIACAKVNQWESIAPGMEYLRVPTPSISTHGRIHAFRVSLEDYNLDIAMAKDYDKLALSAGKFAKKTASLITINGGFFGPNYKPLGLRIQQGVVRSRLKNTSWWGVFYIKNNHAHIVSQRQYRKSSRPDFAIQAGPRLLVNGSIPMLKDGYAERSALCITTQGDVVIAITERAPLTTTQFARILQRPVNRDGLGCHQALNLDGGSSSQLYAQLPDFSLKVMSFHDVTDAVIVEPKRRSPKPLKKQLFVKHPE